MYNIDILNKLKSSTNYIYKLATLASLIFILFSTPSLLNLGHASSVESNILHLTIDSTINPVTAIIFEENINKLNSNIEFQALIVELDTPGGLDTSMRKIIKAIKNSKKPVILFVSPSGSRAASAGAFIVLAAHVSAMSPGSSIGAASPVLGQGAEMSDTMKAKLTNDAASYIESLATDNNHNPTLAREFVTKSVSISAEDGLKRNIIDLLAKDIDELLLKLNNRKVKTIDGEKVLKTENITIVDSILTLKQRLLDIIADPNVAYILMMLGMYGLILEFYNPGSVLPGVIGSIALVLALFAAQLLPINYTGVLLIMLGFIMFFLEIWITSYGILTIGGVIAFGIGSFILIDSPFITEQINFWLIIEVMIANLFIFGFFITKSVQAVLMQTRYGADRLVGREAILETQVAEHGMKMASLNVDGIFWNVDLEGQEDIVAGDKVVILKRDGLLLKVKRSTKDNSS
ncbi:MAG: NfeD family protein [Nitrospinota bacterium]